MNSLAILDRPKFQFNVHARSGLNLGLIRRGREWTGSGLLGLGTVDHFVNRPFRIMQGHWPTGEVAQKFVVKIDTARA